MNKNLVVIKEKLEKPKKHQTTIADVLKSALALKISKKHTEILKTKIELRPIDEDKPYKAMFKKLLEKSTSENSVNKKPKVSRNTTFYKNRFTRIKFSLMNGLGTQRLTKFPLPAVDKLNEKESLSSERNKSLKVRTKKMTKTSNSIFDLKFRFRSPQKKQALSPTPREKLAEQKVVNLRREVIYSKIQQRKKELEGFKIGSVLPAHILSPRIKVDRKLFSLSPSPILGNRYNKIEESEDHKSLSVLKNESRKKSHFAKDLPSSKFKKVYKSIGS